MASASALPHPILGTFTFGTQAQVKPQEAGVMLRTFVGSSVAKTASGVHLDTARMYQSETPDGDSETVLGEQFDMSPSLLNRTYLATKAFPQCAPHFSLSKESVIAQCNLSLEKLQLDCVDLYYLHMPDIDVDIEDTLSGIEQLHKEGKFKEFGLSNYPAWAVVDIWYRCKNRGMVLPTVYQGMYNVITRDMESEIVPVARQFGMKLFMYNPLAGGLLTGRYRTREDVMQATAGRFSPGLGRVADLYKQRYGNAALVDAMQVLLSAIEGPVEQPGAEPAQVEVSESVEVVNGKTIKVRVEETTVTADKTANGLDLVSVAIRWLIHHSYLRGGDGIILGASKTQQLVQTLAAWQAGPLPPEIVEACDKAWEVARPGCEPYFRGYGAKPGGIEKFVAKKEAEEKPTS